MPVLVTSKFDEDPIKTERASLETPFSHYKSMGVVRSGRNLNSSEILYMSSLPAGLKTSSPNGNDRSPESNVPMSNLILKKMDPINSNPGKVEASIFLTMKAGLLHS